MKKIFLILFLLSFYFLPAWGQSDFVNVGLNEQYQIEITNFIEKQYPITHKKIIEISQKAESKYQKTLKNNGLYLDFCIENYDVWIFMPIFDFYSDLLKITQRYYDIPANKIPVTDSAQEIFIILAPYLKENQIDIKKLKELNALTNSEYKKIEEHYTKLHKIIR